jgi:hypothetical protein
MILRPTEGGNDVDVSIQLADALHEIRQTLVRPQRWTNSAKVFAHYFLEEEPARPLSDCPRLRDVAAAYSALLTALGHKPPDPKACLRYVIGAGQIRQGRVSGSRWSPLHEELERAADSATNETQRRPA